MVCSPYHIGGGTSRPWTSNADDYVTVDAGKSSLLGVLVKGDLDDGRGRARVNLFRHKHEIETGRTSSVGMEILGFDTAGEVVTSETPGSMLHYCNSNNAIS